MCQSVTQNSFKQLCIFIVDTVAKDIHLIIFFAKIGIKNMFSCGKIYLLREKKYWNTPLLDLKQEDTNMISSLKALWQVPPHIYKGFCIYQGKVYIKKGMLEVVVADISQHHMKNNYRIICLMYANVTKKKRTYSVVVLACRNIILFVMK